MGGFGSFFGILLPELLSLKKKIGSISVCETPQLALFTLCLHKDVIIFSLINRIWSDITTENYKELGTDYLKVVLKLAGSMGSDSEETQHSNTSELMTDTITFTMVHVSTIKRYINEVNNVTSYSRVRNRRSPWKKSF